MEKYGIKAMNFAKELLNIDSPSGYTKNAISFLCTECNKRGLNYEVLNNGSLVISISGRENYTIGLTSHIDTLGAMVRSINNNGTIKFTAIGGPILATYDGEYCKIITRDNRIFTGTFLSNSPAAHVFKDARTMPRTDEYMHIRLDEEVNNKNDVLKLGINNGDFIAVDPKTIITKSNFIKSRFLDDKISASILFSLIDYLNDQSFIPKYNLKLIFTINEEVGFGASYTPNVDELIAVDMGCIGDDLACTEYDVSICAKDSSGPYNFDVTNKLIDAAKKAKAKYVVDIYPFYSSDVSTALRGGNNIKGGLIGPGVAASHGMERTHLSGITNTLRLLVAYIND